MPPVVPFDTDGAKSKRAGQRQVIEDARAFGDRAKGEVPGVGQRDLGLIVLMDEQCTP